MSRPFQATLISFILLLTVLSQPSQARTIIGITPAATPGYDDPVALKGLENEISSRLGETVLIRTFDSEAAQLDWLIRFREIEVALISSSLLRTLPAGTLVPLSGHAATVVVTHPGLAAARQEALRQAFNGLFADERSRQLLRRLDGAPKMTTAPKEQPAAAAAPEPARPAAVAPNMTRQAAPPAPAISRSAPALPAAAAPNLQEPPPKPLLALPPAQTPVKPPSALAPQPSSPPSAPAAEPRSPKRTRLLLLAAMVVTIGIVVKIGLLMRRGTAKHKGPGAPPPPPVADHFALQTAIEPATPFAPPSAASALPALSRAEPAQATALTPAMTAATMEAAPKKRATGKRKAAATKAADNTFPSANNDLVVEQGRLGRTKVPALLKNCADLPQPVILRVRSGDSETCIHFAGGQICHAYSRNWRIDQGVQQWRKLGYLMVRDGIITETQRDQVLELIERQPELRFAAAMQQLGIFDLDALRHILARQAKTAVFALILFCSGEYRIETDNGAIPAEESIALQVEPLIREASHHQAEWTAIRKILPSLGTLLDFAPEGREKLEQVRLSVHQQLLLSQVDGQTPISTLCSDSTMMDYEACRFLYLMVKAGVLQTAPAV